jgi:hypothetical protein
MPPIVPIVIVLTIASFFVAYIMVTYVRREGPPTGDLLTDEELRERDIAERAQRQAAQDRMVANIQSNREARNRREQLLAQKHDASTITSDTLSILRMYWQDYDAYAAFVYLLDGDITLPDDPISAFNPYWDAPEAALWAWQGDNVLDDYTEPQLQRAAESKQSAMRGMLTVVGWRVQETRTFTPDISVIVLVKR